MVFNDSQEILEIRHLSLKRCISARCKRADRTLRCLKAAYLRRKKLDQRRQFTHVGTRTCYEALLMSMQKLRLQDSRAALFRPGIPMDADYVVHQHFMRSATHCTPPLKDKQTHPRTAQGPRQQA
nr:unnamed protein product [Spirometra erinaceieuropaei]